MVPTLIRILIPFLVTFLFVKYVIQLVERDPGKQSRQVLSSALIAMVAAIVLLVSDVLVKYVATPQVVVRTVRSDGGLDISIGRLGIFSGQIDQIAISYPINGSITGFSSVSPTAAAHTEASALGGEDYLLNHLVIQITVLTPKVDLQYKVVYKPSNPHVILRFREGLDYTTNLDRYEVAYTWHYEQISGYVSQWRLVENDEITTPPTVTLSGTHKFRGPSSQLEQVIPRRPL